MAKQTEKQVEILRKMLGNGEAIYKIIGEYMFPVYVIGPQSEDKTDPGRYADIAEMLEDTLHRILEAKEDPYLIMNAQKLDYTNPEYYDETGEICESIYEIDLEYAIVDFFPTRLVWIEDYKEPSHTYELTEGRKNMGKINIPDDWNERRILEEVCNVFPRAKLLEEDTVIQDVNGDGSAYLLKPLDETDRCLNLKLAK